MNYFNYFSEIEELFIRRRGRNLLLSPLDWALIETWQEREVPLHIILGGIERVFDSVDKQPLPRKRTVKSLLYCKEEIEAQFAEWQERQVGKNSASTIQKTEAAVEKAETDTELPTGALFTNDAMIAHLEKVSLELKSAQDKALGDFQKTLIIVSSRLTELIIQKSHTPENLEESLEKLDALIDQSLLRNFETETIKGEVEKQIASHKSKMEREVHQRTLTLMLLKRLREKAEIPRLSLFYL